MGRVQILDEAICISLNTNAFMKDMNQSLLTTALGKMVGQTGFSSLSRATSTRRKNSEFKI